jgi:hypothetical protein
MVEVEHLVLGNGFFGVAVYKALQGEKLMVSTALPEAASKSAAGIITESWYTASTVRNQYAYPFTPQMVTSAVSWLMWNGAKLKPTPEVRQNEVNDSLKTNNDTWLLWNKDEYLNSCPFNDEAINSIDFNTCTVTTDKTTYKARHLHVALGINLMNFTEEVPLKGRKGEAIFIKSDEQKLITYYVAPYTHFTQRPWGNGIVRIGDTTKPKHLEYIKERFGKDGYEITEGIRPAPIKHGYVYHKIGNSHVYTSGGRIGLALSGMVGDNLGKLHKGELRF